MKSIQNFIRRCYLIFSFALVTLGVVCIIIFGMYTVRINNENFDDINFRLNIQLESARRFALNNILSAETMMKQQLASGKVNVTATGSALASLINYNPNQYDIWFALEKEAAEKLSGSPPGYIFFVERKVSSGNHVLGEPSKEIPFNINNYSIFTKENDDYLKDLNQVWYHQVKTQNGKLMQVGPYYDNLYIHKWVTTLAKGSYDAQGKLIGVVGIDYEIDLIKKTFIKIIGSFGITVIEGENNKILFNIPTENYSLILDKDIYTTNVPPFIRNKELDSSTNNYEQLFHDKSRGEWIVYKIFRSIDLDWYIIIYKTAKDFYFSLFSFIFLVAMIMLSFLVFFLKYMNRNKYQLLRPLENLVNCLRRDSKIASSEKNINGHYEGSNIIEIDDLISSINTIFEVVNENFEKHRIELEKNQKIRNDLEFLVKKRSQQLIQREKLASIGLMTTGLAHEIKNPLNLICNAAEIAHLQISKLKQAGIALPEAAEKAIHKIVQSNTIILNNGHRVDNIIKTLLLQSPDQREELRLNDIQNLIETNLDFVLSTRRSQLNNRLEIERNYPPQKILLRFNQVDLGRVFINLFDNSCYALLQKMAQDDSFVGHIKVSLFLENQGVRITIRDNGTGIKKELIPQIFTPFFTTKSPGEGTGLGLSFVFEIINRYNGHIIVDSEVDSFTEFSIFLPFRGDYEEDLSHR